MGKDGICHGGERQMIFLVQTILILAIVFLIGGVVIVNMDTKEDHVMKLKGRKH